MVNSRNKGAAFERDIVKMLKAELGDVVDAESLKRNLTQYQRKDCTDIICGELFAVECKRYADGNWYQQAWLDQAYHSAALLNMIPVLVWKFDRQPMRWTMPLYAVGREFALDNNEHDFPRDGNAIKPITMDTETAMMIMREWLA